MESILKILSPLSAVVEQVTLQQCPLNVIYIPFLPGHYSINSINAGKYLLSFPYFVPTQFQETIFLPKNLGSGNWEGLFFWGISAGILE